MNIDKWQERDEMTKQILRAVEKIDTRLDRLDEHLARVDVTLAEQAKDLKYHIMRTDLAEKAIAALDERTTGLENRKWYQEGLVKAAFIFAGATASLLGLLKSLGFF